MFILEMTPLGQQLKKVPAPIIIIFTLTSLICSVYGPSLTTYMWLIKANETLNRNTHYKSYVHVILKNHKLP